jgi:hypothetical protein
MADIDTSSAPDIELTREMIRAGVRTFYAWDPDKEEAEALAVGIFFSMLRAKTSRMSSDSSLRF